MSSQGTTAPNINVTNINLSHIITGDNIGGILVFHWSVLSFRMLLNGIGHALE